MRRSARVLSATALAGAALGLAATVASADPAAEVNPRSVAPGGTVTVSVTCDTTGGSPPDFIEASSQGFEEGKVQLRHVDGNAESTAGAAFTGTARVAAAGNFDDGPDAAGPQPEWGVDGLCPVAPGGKEQEWTTTFSVAQEGGTTGLDTTQPPVGVQRGVRAGEGGTFTDSVPALVTGGILVTGALGAAVYRLCHRDSSTER